VRHVARILNDKCLLRVEWKTSLLRRGDDDIKLDLAECVKLSSGFKWMRTGYTGRLCEQSLGSIEGGNFLTGKQL
jgi:hypothetical protein